MAKELGLDDAAVKSDVFLEFFSGNSKSLPGAAATLKSHPVPSLTAAFAGMRSWATPYALSIMGSEMVMQQPCS